MKIFKKKWQNIIALILTIFLALIVSTRLYFTEVFILLRFTWNNPLPLDGVFISIIIYSVNFFIVLCIIWFLISLVHIIIQHKIKKWN